MTEWILSSSVLILIIAALRFLLKGKVSLRLQYALWGLVLIRLLMPVSIGSSELSVMNLLPEQKQEAELNSNMPDYVEGQEKSTVNLPNIVIQGDAWADANRMEMQSDNMTGMLEDNTTEHGIVTSSMAEEVAGKIPEIVTVIWLIGMICVALFLFLSNLIFSRKLKISRKKMSGMTAPLSVYLSSAVDTPCLFGLFRPSIYVTNEATENATSLHHILEHEMTHYRHGDHIWAILRGVCLAVHWYNPLVWWAAVLSRTDAELACDEATIKRLGEQERAEYGRTLIGMTCQKRAALFVTATTMTGSKSGIKERITLIVKKPKMAACTLVAVILLAMFAVGCTFTGDKGEVEVDNDITPTVTPTEMLTPEPTETPNATVAPTATILPEATITPIPQVAVLQEYKEVEDALYFTTVQTMLSHSGDDYRYIYYVNQEKAVTAFEKAMEHVQQGKGWKEDDESFGINVMYQGNWYCITREGALVGNGRVEAEDAKELFIVCQEAVEAVGLPEPVRPEKIKGITAATLNYNGTVRITDVKFLQKLEQWLANSEELFGGAACWFTALLTLELESGEQVTISMATDSCGTWLSEGVFYQYASGNEELFELFATQAVFDARKQGMEAVLSRIGGLNWSTYANTFGTEETLSLMEELRDWVEQNPVTEAQMDALRMCADSIDGAYTEIYVSILELAHQQSAENLLEKEDIFDIQAELLAVETTYRDLQKKLQTDASLNQADMNTLAGECATLWEEATDTFWNVLEPLLTAEEVKELNTEQQEWLNERDAEVQAIIEEYDGGSITGLVVGQRKAELTRERVYELADRLEEKINQIMAGPSQDYSGLYVDTQGTDVVYSELKLKLQEDGSYHTEIGIYRLTTFEGTAVQYGDILLFEDPGMRVKGNIQFLDGEAVFTVTESEFEYVTPGEGFEFYKSE